MANLMREPESGKQVTINSNLTRSGRIGTVLGASVFTDEWWTPLIWEDETTPSFHRTSELSEVTPTSRRFLST